MNKYRKKPVVIEAFQMTRARREDDSEWPSWLYEAWNKNHDNLGALYPEDYPNSNGSDRLRIVTLEGNQLVSWDDYIIRGVHGEIYPCKPDIFEKTYEKVASDPLDELDPDKREWEYDGTGLKVWKNNMTPYK